jgi:MoxR-like ATPase
VVYLAERLGKPILVEGPAGVGKTELAKAVATAREAELVRLQCYEGLDEAKALYEWNYRKQLLRITHARGGELGGGEAWDEVEDDLFSEHYLLERPLLHALRNERQTVLLIDEVDKVDLEFEALLLEILSDFQVTIPELGTVRGTRHPFVVLTSNGTRELSEALKRRCLYLHIDYPSVERERAIVLSRVPDAPEAMADQLVRIVRSLRQLELKKPPVGLRDPGLGADAARAGVRIGRRAGPQGHRQRRPQAPPGRRAGTGAPDDPATPGDELTP